MLILNVSFGVEPNPYEGVLVMRLKGCLPKVVILSAVWWLKLFGEKVPALIFAWPDVMNLLYSCSRVLPPKPYAGIVRDTERVCLPICKHAGEEGFQRVQVLWLTPVGKRSC